MAFTHPHTVRFREVDPAGILFFSRLFEICHDAFESAMTEAGYDLREIFENPGPALPLVHVEADYKRPMRLGDRVDVEVALVEVGERSMAFGFRVVGSDGELRATARHVHACIDRERFRPQPLPEDLVASLRRVLG